MVAERSGGTRQPVPLQSRLPRDPSFVDFFTFVHRVYEVPGVEKVKFAGTGERAHIWVLTADEDFERDREIFRLERVFRAERPNVPIEVHLVPLSEISEEDLPPADQLLPTP